MGNAIYVGTVVAGSTQQDAITSYVKTCNKTVDNSKVMFQLSASSGKMFLTSTQRIKNSLRSPVTGNATLQTFSRSLEAIANALDLPTTREISRETYTLHSSECDNCGRHQVSDSKELMRHCILCGEELNQEDEGEERLSIEVADDDEVYAMGQDIDEDEYPELNDEDELTLSANEEDEVELDDDDDLELEASMDEDEDEDEDEYPELEASYDEDEDEYPELDASMDEDEEEDEDEYPELEASYAEDDEDEDEYPELDASMDEDEDEDYEDTLEVEAAVAELNAEILELRAAGINVAEYPDLDDSDTDDALEVDAEDAMSEEDEDYDTDEEATYSSRSAVQSKRTSEVICSKLPPNQHCSKSSTAVEPQSKRKRSGKSTFIHQAALDEYLDTEESLDSEDPANQYNVSDITSNDSLEVDLIDDNLDASNTIANSSVKLVYVPSEAVDNHRWYAIVNDAPVAVATVQSVGNEKSEIFATDSFRKATEALMAQVGITTALQDMGFTALKIQLPVRQIVSRHVAKATAATQASNAKEVALLRNDIKAALATASVGINKGFFTRNHNPIKAELYDVLSNAGVRNAEVLIDDAFLSKSDDYHHALLDQAFDLLKKPVDARNEISAAVMSANYQRAATEEVSLSSTVSKQLSSFGTSNSAVAFQNDVNPSFNERASKVIQGLLR